MTLRILFLFCLIFSASCQNKKEAPSDQLHLKQDGKTMLSYNAKHITSPIKEAPWYGRSGFIHPVYTPNGQVVTEAFPADHPHQHGLMFAWTSSRINGRKVDFWNSHRRQGKIQHVKTLKTSEKEIHVQLEHIELQKEEERKVIEEIWTIKKVDHPKWNVFDLESTQVCTIQEGIKIAKYHYGAMCIRANDHFKKKGYRILTSLGNQRKSANHSRPIWTAIYTEKEGQHFGLVAIQHWKNFRFPQTVRVHPEKPYFCYAPMAQGDFKLEYNKPYKSKFRFIAYDGELDYKGIEQLANSFRGQ